MSIYKNITIAEYPSTDMEVSKLNYYSYAFREIEEAVHVCIWNNDPDKKQVIFFTGEDFKELLLQNKEDQYEYPNCAEMLLDEELKECIPWLDKEEVTKAVMMSGRIDFRISFFELREHMAEHPEYSRSEAINDLVNKKTEKPPMPSLKDMRTYEEAA